MWSVYILCIVVSWACVAATEIDTADCEFVAQNSSVERLIIIYGQRGERMDQTENEASFAVDILRAICKSGLSTFTPETLHDLIVNKGDSYERRSFTEGYTHLCLAEGENEKVGALARCMAGGMDLETVKLMCTSPQSRQLLDAASSKYSQECDSLMEVTDNGGGLEYIPDEPNFVRDHPQMAKLIAGGCIGGVLLICIAITCCLCCRKRREQPPLPAASTSSAPPTTADQVDEISPQIQIEISQPSSTPVPVDPVNQGELADEPTQTPSESLPIEELTEDGTQLPQTEKDEVEVEKTEKDEVEKKENTEKEEDN